MAEKENSNNKFSEDRVHEMVMKKYKTLRNDGILQSLEDIYTKQPMSRIVKQNYVFSFDIVKNHIQQRMNERSKLQKLLSQEMKIIRLIEIKNLREVEFQNQDDLYSEKLKSGLPIFKSIQFLRYQDNEKWTQFFGEERPFIVDESNIDFSQIKVEIGKVKLLLEDDQTLPKINFDFRDENTLEVKYDRFPTFQEIEKRADVMAKLLLLNIYTEEHRKLKQSWKNEKKLKSQIEPQKLKEGQGAEQEQLLKIQVKKILFGLEQRANLIAHDQFKQLNGEKAVQTKKSLEKLKHLVALQVNPRVQLKILVAYKQKKSW